MSLLNKLINDLDSLSDGRVRLSLCLLMPSQRCTRLRSSHGRGPPRSTLSSHEHEAGDFLAQHSPIYFTCLCIFLAAKPLYKRTYIATSVHRWGACVSNHSSLVYTTLYVCTILPEYEVWQSGTFVRAACVFVQGRPTLYTYLLYNTTILHRF